MGDYIGFGGGPTKGYSTAHIGIIKGNMGMLQGSRRIM